MVRLEKVANMNVKHSLTAISYSTKRVYLLLPSYCYTFSLLICIPGLLIINVTCSLMIEPWIGAIFLNEPKEI